MIWEHIDGVWEQSAEENIWAYEAEKYMEKTA